jgi:hypothetical protein
MECGLNPSGSEFGPAAACCARDNEPNVSYGGGGLFSYVVAERI